MELIADSIKNSTLVDVFKSRLKTYLCGFSFTSFPLLTYYMLKRPCVRYQSCLRHSINRRVIIIIIIILSNSSQTDTNSLLTSVFPATLTSISISNISTSAIESHCKMMVGKEGVIPVPVYRFFSSRIGFNMCFHLQPLSAFGLISLSSLFLLKAFVECIISA